MSRHYFKAARPYPTRPATVPHAATAQSHHTPLVAWQQQQHPATQQYQPRPQPQPQYNQSFSSQPQHAWQSPQLSWNHSNRNSNRNGGGSVSGHLPLVHPSSQTDMLRPPYAPHLNRSPMQQHAPPPPSPQLQSQSLSQRSTTTRWGPAHAVSTPTSASSVAVTAPRTSGFIHPDRRRVGEGACPPSGVGGGACPPSPAVQYDASQQTMRDPKNQAARNESRRVRSTIKREKKESLCTEADFQRTQATFAQRKRLHQWDGGCGAGGVTHYASEAGINILIGCDVSQRRVEEAKEVYAKLAKDRRWKKRGGSMVAGFSHADAFADQTHAIASALGPYDIITYFNTLHYAASSIEMLRRQFAFWEQQLTPTGSVIVQTVDAKVLVRRIGEEWTRLHTSFSEDDQHAFCSPEPLRIGNRFYAIEWPAHQTVQGIRTGQPYTFTFLASMEPTTEYVMREEDIMQLATEYGLVGGRRARGGARAPHAREPLSDDEQEVVDLYCTYVFRKMSFDGDSAHV